MNLDPDGTTFWTGDDETGEIYHVDIASGTVLSSFNSDPSTGLYGLSIVGGIVVSQPSITLAPPTGTANVGSPYTLTATITNPGGSVSGQTVDFSVTGANAATGTGTTNASGQATFTYTGANAGMDTVTASFTNSSSTTVTATATVDWAASQPTITLAPPTGTANVGSPYTLTATITNPGGSVSGQTVDFSVTGANTATGTGTTNASGQATFTYTGANAGMDTVTASFTNSSSATVTATATVNWMTVVAVPPAIDTLVHNFSQTGPVTVNVTTTASSDLLVAFVGACGPSNAKQTTTVSGGGLTWTLLGRTNTEHGTAEVWSARASGVLSSVPIKTTLAHTGFPVFLTVVGFSHATGTGTVSSVSGSTGVPKGTLTTSASPSWVWGVGDDPLAATGRKVPSNQTLQSQKLSPTEDTYWVQSLNDETAPTGTTATINDTAPKYDPWNLTLVEIL